MTLSSIAGDSGREPTMKVIPTSPEAPQPGTWPCSCPSTQYRAKHRRTRPWMNSFGAWLWNPGALIMCENVLIMSSATTLESVQKSTPAPHQRPLTNQCLLNTPILKHRHSRSRLEERWPSSLHHSPSGFMKGLIIHSSKGWRDQRTGAFLEKEFARDAAFLHPIPSKGTKGSATPPPSLNPNKGSFPKLHGALHLRSLNSGREGKTIYWILQISTYFTLCMCEVEHK